MKSNSILRIFCILICMAMSGSLSAQNIKFYTSSPSLSVNSVDFDTDSILNIAVKADSSLLGYEMMLFTTMLSRKNGKRKWQKADNLMSETFYGKLRDDGYYHFVAFRRLGGGLSYSELGLSDDDLRYGKIQMNVSLYGKKRLNPINLKGNDANNDVNLINTTTGYIQYEADIIDFSLPVTIERYNNSANVRLKKNAVITGISIGSLCVILSPLLILRRVLRD